MRRNLGACCVALFLAAAVARPALADPCGMVPPIYLDNDPSLLVRVGDQITYVFYKNGIETFVIQPGFSGKVDEFGMLTPFPSPPAIRKVSDEVFNHIAAAIDPPEVVVNVTPVRAFRGASGGGFGGGGGLGGGQVGQGGGFGPGLGFRLGEDEVRVVREEAVGMYEVAVLEAGSARALKQWSITATAIPTAWSAFARSSSNWVGVLWPAR